MSLPWVRLDTAFPFNPKVQALIAEPGGHRAVAVYLMGLSFSGLNGTDGYIPAHSLAFIHGRKADAVKLVDHNLWVPTTAGWDINGWHEKQVSSAEHELRRKRAKDAAMTRWHGPKHDADDDA